MTIPAVPDTHGDPAIMTPEDRLTRRLGDQPPTVPTAFLIVPQDYRFGQLAEDHDAAPIDLGMAAYEVLDLVDGIGALGRFGIGAPALAIAVEEMIALGASTFVLVGGCGASSDAVKPGDAVLAEAAVRDEGTSRHYLPDSRTIEATLTLTEALATAAAEQDLPIERGRTWTTDGFYRETRTAIDRLADDGVLTVEMEAAALFAIAQYRDVTGSALFVPFDRITGDGWEWGIDAAPEERLDAAIEVARTGVGQFAQS